jgi:exosome complex protein LRP1
LVTCRIERHKDEARSDTVPHEEAEEEAAAVLAAEARHVEQPPVELVPEAVLELDLSLFFFVCFYHYHCRLLFVILFSSCRSSFRSMSTKSNRPDAELEADFNARATQLESSLVELESFLSRLDSTSYTTVHESLTPLDQARFDLTAVYTLNSLMWAYLRTRGVDPKQTQLKSELDRVKSYMDKLKSVVDRQSAPRIDKQASTRIMRNALWQQAHAKSKTSDNDNDNDDQQQQSGNNG